MCNLTDYKVENWIDHDDVIALPSSEYWNNRKVENDKAFDVSDGSFSKLESYMNRKGVLQQFHKIADSMEKTLFGKGVSLGSGVCWLEAQIVKSYGAIDNISCVEFSRHRICELAPLILQHYCVDHQKISLCYGSFYELKLPDNEMDFAIFAVSFHHAHKPMKLLKEVKRVLKPEGIVIIVGEHFFNWRNLFKRRIKHLVKIMINHQGYRGKTGIYPKWENIFYSIGEKGDHHYSRQMYMQMLQKNGFRARHFIDERFGIQGFLLNNIK